MVEPGVLSGSVSLSVFQNRRRRTMQRLHSINPQLAQGRTKELLDTVQQAFGVIPNTAKVMANSPHGHIPYRSFPANRESWPNNWTAKHSSCNMTAQRATCASPTPTKTSSGCTHSGSRGRRFAQRRNCTTWRMRRGDSRRLASQRIISGRQMCAPEKPCRGPVQEPASQIWRQGDGRQLTAHHHAFERSAERLAAGQPSQ